jgi:hypothetical protein
MGRRALETARNALDAGNCAKAHKAVLEAQEAVSQSRIHWKYVDDKVLARMLSEQRRSLAINADRIKMFCLRPKTEYRAAQATFRARRRR